MKKYILILTAVVLAVMSCSTDNIENGPSSLDIEIVPAWDITRGITSASQTVKLTVNLNVQTIHWQVSSDSEWCKVDSDLIHTGSDEVELVVESNDSFDKRNAVLTVTAGRYTKKVEIDQAGNVFVMSDVYKILGSNEALSYDVEVRTTSEWTIEAPDWIEAEKVGTPTVDEFGQTTTVMHVSIDANPGEQSRYGAVQLIPTEGYNGEFTVFQFGSEVNMTDDGKIAVAAEGNVSFEVTAPFGIIEKVEVPYWVQCTETPAEDGLNSVFEFWIGKNLSDTKAGRECVVEFTVKDSGRSIALPAITQDFVPAGGIVTGPGFKMFAEAWNAGEDISYWTTENEGGVLVNVLSDINMSEVETWTPIGTAARPFDGVFRGNGWLVKAWKGDASLFGHVGAGATVQDIIVDEDCSMTFSGSVTSGSWFGVIAGVSYGVIENCENRAAVAVENLDASAETGFGGIVGLCDNGTVRNCKNKASFTVAESVVSNASLNTGGIAGKSHGESSSIVSCSNDGSMNVYARISEVSSALRIGGIAGEAAGVVSGCSTGEKMLIVSTDASRTVYCGGVAGYSTAAVSDCVNAQPVSTTLYRSGDAVYNEYTGGVVGYQASGSIKSCTNRGSMISSSNQQYLYMGGIAGDFAEGEAENNVNVAKLDLQGDATSAVKGVRYASVGGLYGRFGAVQSDSDKNSSNSGPITVLNVETAADNSTTLNLGGVAGYIDSESPLSSLTNTGAVTADLVANFTAFAIGGIAGSTECGISDSKNSGTLMINNGILLKNTSSRICFGGIAGRNVAGDLNTYSGCVNDGEVGISTKSNDFNILPAFTGGILGYTEMPVAVKGCENNGYVNSSGANNKYDGLFSAAGGIVGAIVETVAEVADCIVSVDIRNYAYNRNIDMDPFKMCHCGSIVGCAVGESQSNIVKISNCSNSGTLENKRSTAAGIVGFAKYAAVSDCRFTGSVVGSGPHFAAGIAGCLSDASVTDCIVKSPDIYSHSSLGFNSINHFPAAGIVGYLYGKSSVSRCKAFATLIQNVGSTANEQMHVGMELIAGISTAGSTISDCGVGGTLNTGSAGKVQNVIMTVTSDNFGNCIVGDGNVTPSGCYYWNGQE